MKQETAVLKASSLAKSTGSGVYIGFNGSSYFINRSPTPNVTHFVDSNGKITPYK